MGGGSERATPTRIRGRLSAVGPSDTSSSDFEDRVVERLGRRVWPILISVVYVGLGLAYCFRWGPLVRHQPSLWLSPGDSWAAYAAAGAAAHGHFDAVYTSGFLGFPGILVLLAPLGALANSFSTSFIQIVNPAHPAGALQNLVSHGTPYFNSDVVQSGAKLYVVHRQAFVVLLPLILILSCTALFAFDALAERLGVPKSRRAILCVTEAVLLWNVTVFPGHPEDALAVALLSYALIFALDGRFTGAGWLFGVAMALQPLVIVVFPLLLVLGGRGRALGLVVRGAIPLAAVVVAPLVGDFHSTVHALVTQPTFPNVVRNHKTPWTFLAPHLDGRGSGATVAGGPQRIVALLLAAGVGWWALRWRQRPEMIVWAAAVALALRVYFESVMPGYYVWPALAVGLVVAARGSTTRFAMAIAVAVATTVVSRWQLGEFPWWAVQVGGVTALLVVAAKPEATEPLSEEKPVRASTAQTRQPGASKSKDKRKKKAARTDRKRSARR